MEIVKYETVNGILTVGFKENEFVVYAQVPKKSGVLKAKLLQDAYKVARSSIEYEKTQTVHSFTTDETGFEFVPDEPAAERIEIVPLNSVVFEEGQETVSVPLLATVYDQYDEVYNAAVEWSATIGTIESGQLTVGHPVENEAVTVTAEAQGITAETELTLYPYVKPVYGKPIEEEIDDLKTENVVNMMAMVEMFEKNIQLEQENTMTMIAITELFEVMTGGV